MKTSIIVAGILALSVGQARAECFARSASVSDMPLKIQRVAEYQKNVTPNSMNGLTCRVNFRAQINGQWYTAEGESTGKMDDNLDGLCANAEQLGRARILQDVGGANISVNTDMVCTDQDISKVRTVQVGEIVRQSEVAPNPQKMASFQYMGTECRWFLETMPLGVGGMAQNQGIICRIRDEQWVVRDKWIQVVDR